MPLSFKDIHQKFHKPLLLILHWEELSHMALSGYREAEKCKSNSRCLLCHELYISVLQNERKVRYDQLSIPLRPPISFIQESFVWAKVAWLLPSLSTYGIVLPLYLQTCCFSCLKCFLWIVFSFKVQLELNSYFFVKLISPAYKCIDSPTNLTHRMKRDLRDHLVSCYSK